MNITHLVSPGIFPTVVRDPGNWFKEISHTDHNIELYNANKEFWSLLFDYKIYNIVSDMITSAKCRDQLIESIESSKKILNELTNLEVYQCFEKYIEYISYLVKHIRIINYIQQCFNIDFITGITVNDVTYKSLLELISFSKEDTILTSIIDKVLENIQTNIELLLVQVNSPRELLTSIICIKLLKRKNPNMYVCLIDHGYENFSLKQFSYDSESSKEILKIFDSIIEYKNEKDTVVKALIEDLCKGNTKKGFIKLSDFKFEDTQSNNINLLPCTTLFTAEPTLSTRLLPSGCYWGKCVFCTQNTKNKSLKTPPISHDAALDRIEYFIKSGYSSMSFSDEALSPRFLEKLSREIISRNLKFKWTCRCRLEEEFTKDILYLMKQAGCLEILYGLESTSPRVLELMNKYKNIPDDNGILTILNNTYECGISIHITIIVGFPGEEPCEAKGTIEFITDKLKDIPNSTYWINKFTLFNNTAIINDPERFNIEILPEEGDLLYFKNFKYKEGTYKDEKVLNSLIRDLNNKLCAFLGWNKFGNSIGVKTAMLLYFFSSHGIILKDRNTLYPSKASEVKEKVLF